MRRAANKDLPLLNYILSEHFDITKDDAVPENLRYTCGSIVFNKDAWVVLSDDNKTLYVLRPMNGCTYECHIASMSEGKSVIRDSRVAIGWFFKENPLAMKIVCIFPENRRDVRLLCYHCGFRQEGLLSKSFLKNGTLLDQVVYGLSKEDICQ